ncbi:MAG: aldehyde dehydrogenase family protein [Candidatus Dormibacteraceae bacterium]
MATATVFTAAALVDGRWVVATSGGRGTRESPYSAAQASVASLCGRVEVEAARRFAIASARSIREIPPFRRAEILERAAELLTVHGHEIAVLETSELGKPIKDTSKEVLRAGETLRTAAAEARRLGGEVLPTEGWPAGAGSSAIAVRVPVGIVLAITPFNAPLNLLIHKIAASFAAGNTTIVKSPPQAPGTSTRLVQILLEAGMPEDAIQLLHGGAELGDAMVRIPELGAVAFTGSPAAGRQVAEGAAGKRLVLELGGNAATLVCADADLNDAARVCAQTGYSNSGQSCISVQRVYVETPRFEEFVALFRDCVAALRVGDPLDPQTDVGTMVDAAAAGRVASWVAEAVAAGGRLELGGVANGAALAPTVIAEPPRNAKVVTDEVFGALVSLLPFSDFSSGIREANSTPYGLQGGLFTFDLRRVFQAIRDFEVGGLVINGSSTFRLDHLPFGGIKDSGIGRESPRWMIEDFTYLKTVHFRGLSLWA